MDELRTKLQKQKVFPSSCLALFRPCSVDVSIFQLTNQVEASKFTCWQNIHSDVTGRLSLKQLPNSTSGKASCSEWSLTLANYHSVLQSGCFISTGVATEIADTSLWITTPETSHCSTSFPAADNILGQRPDSCIFLSWLSSFSKLILSRLS